MTIAANQPDDRICFVDCGKSAPECHCKARFPYTHHGPTVYGSKLADYLVTEASMIEDGMLSKPVAATNEGNE